MIIEKRESFINSTNLIRNAIDNDLVVPFFQGIYDNKNKIITKYEALVRIEQDDKVISPYEFLEPARLSGLLPEITKIMIDKSFKVMSKNTHTFSINITEDDLAQDYLVEYLEQK
ncbi:MAG: EAL domain-containing protein [Aliarcobacter sp.]|nr:EAL domain-containing protein [Aliarcobacter sp.]